MPSECAPWIALAVLLASASAFADAAGGLTVERGPGAESCPDARALTALVQDVRGRAAGVSAAYSVRFERRGPKFHARIQSPADTATRSLADTGDSCAALARATAVSIALLVDADAAVKTDRAALEPAAPATAPADTPARHTAPRERSPTSERAAITAYLGTALVTGVVRPSAPALSAGVGFTTRLLRTSAGAFWVVPGDVALGPGTVRTSLVGGALEACVTPWKSEPARVEVCSGLFAGRVRAKARGYSVDEQRSRPWYAFPFGLAASIESAPFAAQAGAAALVPVRRQDFRVEGVGVAYESAPVGGLIWIRVMTLVPW